MPADPRSWRRLLGRASWNLVDQVLSSATNAVLSFLVARTVSPESFGGFAVAFTVFALVIGLARALATSPLGIRHSGDDPETFADAAGRAAGTSLALGLLGGLGCAVAGLLLPGAVGTALVALALVLPGLLVQDAWRYVFFAAARPAAAALNDLVWAVVQFAAVGVLLTVGVDAAWPLVLAWGVAGAGAALLGIGQARVRPRLSAARAWTVRHLDLTRFMVAEYGTLQGCQQGTLLLVAAIGSLEAIGALRAVQVLLGPTTILAVAAFGFVIPEFSRRRDTMTGPAWRRAALLVGAVVAAMSLAWGAFFLLAPDVVGRTLLGSTWPGTREVLLPTVAGQVAAALSVGPAGMLYALDRARRTFFVHLVEAPLVLAGGVAGVLLDGAVGAAWGMAVPFWVALPLLWVQLQRELGTRDRARVPQ